MQYRDYIWFYNAIFYPELVVDQRTKADRTVLRFYENSIAAIHGLHHYDLSEADASAIKKHFEDEKYSGSVSTALWKNIRTGAYAHMGNAGLSLSDDVIRYRVESILLGTLWDNRLHLRLTSMIQQTANSQSIKIDRDYMRATSQSSD